MPNVLFFILLGLAILIGSVPTAYIVVKKLKGIDIRTVGSGNVGATNASRVLGKPLGLLILLIDAGKGALCAWLLPVAYEWLGGGVGLFWENLGIRGVGLCMGLGAFLGHCFSPFLRFKGGKGVATALGVYLVLAPWATLLTAAVCVAIIVITRLVSLASITGAILLPVMMLVFDLTLQQRKFNAFVFIATVALSGMVIFRHRANILRLIKGKENKA